MMKKWSLVIHAAHLSHRHPSQKKKWKDIFFCILLSHAHFLGVLSEPGDVPGNSNDALETNKRLKARAKRKQQRYIRDRTGALVSTSKAPVLSCVYLPCTRLVRAFNLVFSINQVAETQVLMHLKRFLFDEMLKCLVEQTNLYNTQMYKTSVRTGALELEQYLGMFLKWDS